MIKQILAIAGRVCIGLIFAGLLYGLLHVLLADASVKTILFVLVMLAMGVVAAIQAIKD